MQAEALEEIIDGVEATEYSQIGDLVTSIIDNEDSILVTGERSTGETPAKKTSEDQPAAKRPRTEEGSRISEDSEQPQPGSSGIGKLSDTMKLSSKSQEKMRPVKISKLPRLYSCPKVAECKFPYSSSIDTIEFHIRKQHLKKPLSCLVCPEVSWSNKGMNKHIRSKHPDAVIQPMLVVVDPDE